MGTRFMPLSRKPRACWKVAAPMGAETGLSWKARKAWGSAGRMG